jgi:uncharacterized protein YndB with AHSA1/START domain
MPLQDDTTTIRWKLHLRSSPEAVYRLLATDEGCARFWAESTADDGRTVEFRFPGGEQWRGTILEHRPPHRFTIIYYGGSRATFALADDGEGGTDLTLTDEGVPPADHVEVIAGWVSVLLALKATADFDVDLRNHDPRRIWGAGYVDN